ncbi:hypothetical protein C0081_13715 [Cohaesibacter celericrescens]|uniref:Uncharacterized protein n=2 Tax=Cohaesibacter celericrescens TaxID=2067669 RepID=A0A2N5XQ92_9HYPH|nr:hypothetical protein C0081_13715 [Cohaesibacter celericrescens]
MNKALMEEDKESFKYFQKVCFLPEKGLKVDIVDSKYLNEMNKIRAFKNGRKLECWTYSDSVDRNAN